MPHRHVAVKEREECFTRCVAFNKCDPRSHGNVCRIETCSCGASRRINSNQGFREKSEWIIPKPGVAAGQ